MRASQNELNKSFHEFTFTGHHSQKIKLIAVDEY